MTEDDIDFEIHKDDLDVLDKVLKGTEKQFNKTEHDTRSRLEITKLILWWYFILISLSFLFSGIYNFLAAWVNNVISIGSHPQVCLEYLDVYKTVTIITTALTGIVGFVIGYYFKGSNEATY